MLKTIGRHRQRLGALKALQQATAAAEAASADQRIARQGATVRQLREENEDLKLQLTGARRDMDALKEKIRVLEEQRFKLATERNEALALKKRVIEKFQKLREILGYDF